MNKTWQRRWHGWRSAKKIIIIYSGETCCMLFWNIFSYILDSRVVPHPRQQFWHEKLKSDCVTCINFPLYSNADRKHTWMELLSTIIREIWGLDYHMPCSRVFLGKLTSSYPQPYLSSPICGMEEHSHTICWRFKVLTVVKK
jgi:hypothetical protein